MSKLQMQILIAIKFKTLKSAKCYSSEIKWVYSIISGGYGGQSDTRRTSDNASCCGVTMLTFLLSGEKCILLCTEVIKL